MSAPAMAQDSAASLQGSLVQAATDIRAVEQQLQGIEDRLGTLAVKRANLESEYNARRVKMAVALEAMTRMSRMPREAVLIRPGGPLQAARTQMLLSDSMPVIEKQALSFRSLLEDLEKTRSELAEKATQAQMARSDLAARHASLSALLAKREAGSPNLEAESAAIANLVRDARNLRELLGSLSSDGQKLDLSVVAVPEGDGQLPVSGIIRVRYGQTDPNAGGRSSGLSIETLPGAVVVAPLGGIVRYAGPFKGYGNIVIIAHKGGYHSLISGLDKISVSAGQTIVSGEPIAILDTVDQTNQADRTRRTVYYELRYGGQPIDPSRKLPDLG